MTLSKKKIGLALGSGGARGLVHIGVIKALLKAGYDISYIAGTSIGACVGAMYAASLDIEAIEKKVLDDKWEVLKVFFDPSIGGGMVKGNKLAELLESWIGANNFSQLKIPFSCVAADLVSGEEVRMDSGDLISAVQASMTVPVLLKPVERGGKMLVDGGVINPVPDCVARDMGADYVIAVNLDHRKNSDLPPKKYRSLNRVSLRVLNIMRHYMADYSMQEADMILNPEIDDPGVMGLKSYATKKRAKALIELGERLMREQLH